MDVSFKEYLKAAITQKTLDVLQAQQVRFFDFVYFIVCFSEFNTTCTNYHKVYNVAKTQE